MLLLLPRSSPWRFVLMASTLAFSWLALQAVHELGHIAHLWLSGGTIEQVVLHPLRLSHTMPGQNPCPLFVVIGGPLWGCVLPLVFWGCVRTVNPRRAYLARFFAATCLVANGTYLAIDAWALAGDGRELVMRGVPPGMLSVIGALLLIAGLALWNGQGKHFGLGPDALPVRRVDAVLMCVLLAALTTLELLFGLPS